MSPTSAHPLPTQHHAAPQEKVEAAGRGDGEFWLRANATCLQPAGGSGVASSAIVELLLTLPEFRDAGPEVSRAARLWGGRPGATRCCVPWRGCRLAAHPRLARHRML